MGSHLIDGKFQSDKYPTCPRGKVPLSCEDKTAQDLLWEYAQRRRSKDAEFSDDLEEALKLAGYTPPMTRLIQLTRAQQRMLACAVNEPDSVFELAHSSEMLSARALHRLGLGTYDEHEWTFVANDAGREWIKRVIRRVPKS